MFGTLAAISLGMALVFAWMGAWLILPYSLAELSLLYLAFRLFERNAGDWECLTVVDDRVVLEARRGEQLVRHEFNRFWVRLEAPIPEAPVGAVRPVLRFAGREVEFGAHLVPEDRQRVARELKAVLARAR